MVFRAFISIDLQGNDRIRGFFDDLKSIGRGLKVVEPNTLHITLKFLGDIDESIVPQINEAMKDASIGIAPFPIQLKGAGTFGRSKIRTVWIGINNSGNLARMAGVLDERLSALGFAREERPFSAHLTLARAKESCDSRKVREIVGRHQEEDFGTQMAEALRLKKSVLKPEGPSYSTVQEVQLKPR